MMILAIVLSIFCGVSFFLLIISKRQEKKAKEQMWEYRKLWLLKNATEEQRKAYEKISSDINSKPLDDLLKDE